MTDESPRGSPLCYLMGAMYVFTGVSHFLVPDLYEQAVPPTLPRPRLLVFLSGVAEVVLGLGMLVPRTRRLSAWGLIALLVAVFPANVHMARANATVEGLPDWADPPNVALWARLPLQAALVAWAWLYTRPAGE